MLRTLCAALLGIAAATVAVAQTPLDPTGFVTGWVPPARGLLKCERYMNKRAHLAGLCTLKCDAKMVDYLIRNLPFDDTVCEVTGPASCKAKYDRSLESLSPGLCPSCLGSAGQATIFETYNEISRTITGQIYCAPGTPLPGDNTGFVPPQIDTFKCERKFGRNVQKAIKCLGIKCHRQLADDLFAGTPAFNLQACEVDDPFQSCKARYEFDNSKLTGCPSCLDAAARALVFDNVRAALAANNELQYCAF